MIMDLFCLSMSQEETLQQEYFNIGYIAFTTLFYIKLPTWASIY